MMRKILLIAFLLPLLVQAQDRAADSLALVEIYNGLKGEQWTGYETWLSNVPLEEWKGLRIAGNRVVKVELINSNAEGPFPNALLGMEALETIEFRNAKLSGTLPAEIGELKGLRRFAVSSCGLEGEVPNVFKDLPLLDYLILHTNNFEGLLPDLGKDLILAYMGRNNFSGKIPGSYEEYSVANLQLNDNQLEGSFVVFSKWDVRKMDLSNNNWDASKFPIWVDDMPNLERFQCDNCNLYGELPSTLDFSELTQYDGMFVSDNDLTGDISKLFNNPDHGQKLYLRARSNNFEGTLPLDKAKSFSRLDVYDNKYNAMTPPEDAVISEVNIQYNDFNFEALAPVKDLIALDSITFINYENQNDVFELDTFVFNTPQKFGIRAGDEDPNTTYIWYKNNQIIDGEEESTLDIDINDNSQSGKYYCRMQNPDYPELELRREILQLDIDLTTNTSDVFGGTFKIYPNPAHEFIYLDLKETNGYKSYRIINSMGQLLQEGQNDSSHTIDVSSLEGGVYFISIATGKSTVLTSFIKL